MQSWEHTISDISFNEHEIQHTNERGWPMRFQLPLMKKRFAFLGQIVTYKAQSFYLFVSLFGQNF